MLFKGCLSKGSLSQVSGCHRCGGDGCECGEASIGSLDLVTMGRAWDVLPRARAQDLKSRLLRMWTQIVTSPKAISAKAQVITDVEGNCFMCVEVALGFLGFGG